jgi:hypothetical protein
MTDQQQETPVRQETAVDETGTTTAPPAPLTAGPDPALPDPAVPDPAVPDPAPVSPPKKDRRTLWAALRWTAAVAVFAAVGVSTAYGITRADRTDLPGLTTASDGRWDYPRLTRPPLPSGSPGPFDEGNGAGTHYADLRGLVLPAPKGATADKALRGTDGWLATKDFLAAYAEKDDREALGGLLADRALRHVAARGWTTPDGTHTRIYLLQFNTAAVADDLFVDELSGADSPPYALRGAGDSVFDEHWPDKAVLRDVHRSTFVEAKPYGAEQVRQAYLSAGDVVALITQSRKGSAKAVPFQQTVVLQGQLLS